MSFAIIGAGRIGQALAKAFARKDIAVSLASRTPPAQLAELARSLGRHVTPRSLSDAVAADTILLAVPFWAHRDVARSLTDWTGKTLIDVTNAHGVDPDELGGLPSSVVVANAFAGAQLVKGFNHLVASVLAENPAVPAGRRVVFLSSDHPPASERVRQLAERLGFAPVELGGLAEGGLLVQAKGTNWGPLIFQDLAKSEQR
jgi:8-hydroxy-5-deazaflavin:NADPH oxidoreductase